MKKLEDYRSLFPITKEMIYLNHAATSPLSLRVIEMIEEHFHQRSTIIVENWDFVLDKIKELRTLLAKLVGTDNSRIALVYNTSHGLNIVASGLEWKEGDEILIPEGEFPSNVYPFLNLRRKGVKIKLVPTPSGGLEPETLLSAITPVTKLLSVSFVEFLSGYKTNLKAIGEICHDHGIIFVVDAIQGLGAIPIDVIDCSIDALACGGHKWLMFPQGIGFLYITKELQDKIQQSHLGWMSVENPEDFLNYNQKLSPDARRFECGCLNSAGIIGATVSLAMLLEIGQDIIYQHLISLTSRLIEGLEERDFRIFTNKDLKKRSGIITFYPRDKSKSERLFNFFEENSIGVSIREEMIRISPHFYNTLEEMNFVLDICGKFQRKH
ncbi:MAG: aminotransferase class V-fold PLP-dependent enzyme [Candidatus Marinimicrobia bacterium]|nr:aminotransferase class V-fold PLP-dependent enzyme [Candidatus Neomarinimicrobiota bacterium]